MLEISFVGGLTEVQSNGVKDQLSDSLLRNIRLVNYISLKSCELMQTQLTVACSHYESRLLFVKLYVPIHYVHL